MPVAPSGKVAAGRIGVVVTGADPDGMAARHDFKEAYAVSCGKEYGESQRRPRLRSKRVASLTISFPPPIGIKNDIWGEWLPCAITGRLRTFASRQ